MGYDPEINVSDPSSCPSGWLERCFATEQSGLCADGEDGYNAVVELCGRFRTIDNGPSSSPRYCHYILSILDYYKSAGGCEWTTRYSYWISSDDPIPPYATEAAIGPDALGVPENVLTEQIPTSNILSCCSCRRRSRGINLLLLKYTTLAYMIYFSIDNPPHIQHLVDSLEHIFC